MYTHTLLLSRTDPYREGDKALAATSTKSQHNNIIIIITIIIIIIIINK